MFQIREILLKVLKPLFNVFYHEIDRYIEVKFNERFETEFDHYMQIHKQLNEFDNASDDFLASRVEAKTDINNLIHRFNSLHIPVQDVILDVNDFQNWLKEYKEIVEYYKNMGNAQIEKLLEHYITMKFLSVIKTDVYIDVASSSSPFADIMARHLGNKTFSQDLLFPQGINGNKIGGDAGNMPVPDQFSDVLTLHCAYECFQGDSDMNFIKEAGRILKKDGRLGIVPLYIDDVYFIKTGPRYNKMKVNAEKGARWIWRDDKNEYEPFSRHYSPESFKERVFDLLNNMQGEVLYFKNLEEIKSKYPDQLIYCHFMFRAVKG